MEDDKKLPYEPSFGWVGRTDLDLSYIPGSHSRSGDYEASYPDYEAEARPRNSATNRSIGEVVQSRRRPLLGPSPG